MWEFITLVQTTTPQSPESDQIQNLIAISVLIPKSLLNTIDNFTMKKKKGFEFSKYFPYSRYCEQLYIDTLII